MKHFPKLHDALLHALDQNDLEMMVRFKMGVVLDDEVPPGPFKRRVYDFIVWCDREGRVDELLTAALEQRPGNPKLRAFAKQLADEAVTIHRDLANSVLKVSDGSAGQLVSPKANEVREILSGFETNGSLQALVVAAPHLNSGQDLVTWASRLQDCHRRVCSIGRDGQHVGTGFLIGPDRIMTNSHVVAMGQIDSYDVVFDYTKGQSRSSIRPAYRFKAELCRSMPRDLDYVGLQLDQIPAGNRGYFKPKAYPFKNVREPISVVGFPNGDPLSIAFGVVFDNNSFVHRVAYTANTAPGSSGSPVFSEDWELVALHHHGEENVNNHGIPMKDILADPAGRDLLRAAE